ncbi:MAG: esterase [Paenibacillaceae bacterium]|jgi:S-formylglutathione hydrolase FrmB|nr:esterase [Paenibacillaceae bacterium]
MAFIDCHFFSDSLGVSSSMYVILPQVARSQIGMHAAERGGKHPTLYLLHGLSDDHTIWLRRTSIERYASALGLAVVMPAVNRSFYADMPNGQKYWQFISEELPRLAQSFFPLSDKREDNFVAGLSMGGYGAMKLGLTCHERFAAAASLSGVMDAAWAVNGHPSGEFQWLLNGKTSLEGTGLDLFHLAGELASSKVRQPKLYQCCGTEDFLYNANIRFRDHCRELGLELTYEEEPGTHDWGYWDAKIQQVLKWLPLTESK